MRKLKVALTLLFAMCFSLFLFACGGNKSGVKSVEVSGAKTTYAETDQASAFSTEGLVVKVIYKEDMKKDDNGNVIPVELKADEYTVDSSAIKWGTVGTYTVLVTPNNQKENDPSLTKEVSGSYEVKIEHAYGAANESGERECSVCGAKIQNLTVDDTVQIEGWGTAATIDKKNDKSTVEVATGRHYASYGKIGVGQRITIRGTAVALASNNTYYFPIIGVANGTKGVVIRNDNWIIYDGPGSDFQWPNHTAGGNPTQGAIDVATANEWDFYQDGGTTCSTTDYATEAQVEITWNYREDGIVQFTINNITAGKKVTFDMKVPAATYDAVLYGEQLKMHITEIEIERNLSIQNFEVLHTANKLAYAENTMFDETGIETKATYNKGITSSITTYDLYADITTGEGDDAVTTTYDLRTTPLTKAMKNFRLEFSGYSIALPIEVTESVIKGVQADWYIGGMICADDVDYVYGVNAEKEITIFASGTASKIPEDWKDDFGVPAGYDHYISLRLLGSDKNVKTGAIAVTGDTVFGQGNWTVPDGKPGYGEVLVAVKTGEDGKIAPFTITLKEITTPAGTGIDEVTKDWTIKVDASALAIPAVSSVQDGLAYIDEGGEITVNYAGDALKTESLSFKAGSGILTYAQLNALNATDNTHKDTVVAMRGTMEITAFTHDKENGTLAITYKLLAPSLTSSFANTFEVSVMDANRNVLADETLRYTYEMSSNYEANGFVKHGNAYIKAEGTRLIAIQFVDDADVEADVASDVKLNVQNDSATIYDLSVKALAGNTAQFVAVNDLTKAAGASARVSILGTVGNDADYDRGAALISVVDVSALGLSNTTGYYFEAVKADVSTGYDIYKVVREDEKDTITKQNVTTPADRDGGVLGDCILDTLQYYELKDGQTILFKYGQSASDAHGNHNYVDGRCTKCGSVQIAAPTIGSAEHANGTEIAKLDAAAFTESANKNIVSRGLTVSFDGKNPQSDWNSIILGTASNLNIAMGALDPWWSTGDFASTNMYPGLVDAAYDIMYNKEGYFTVTVSVETGVTYYLNGIKILQYPAMQAMGQKTVGDFVEAFLTEVAANGMYFAPLSHGDENGTGRAQSMTDLANLTIVTKAMTADEVYEYVLSMGKDVKVSDLGKWGETATLVWLNKGEKVTLTTVMENGGDNPYNGPVVQPMIDGGFYFLRPDAEGAKIQGVDWGWRNADIVPSNDWGNTGVADGVDYNTLKKDGKIVISVALTNEGVFTVTYTVYAKDANTAGASFTYTINNMTLDRYAINFALDGATMAGDANMIIEKLPAE